MSDQPATTPTAPFVAEVRLFPFDDMPFMQGHGIMTIHKEVMHGRLVEAGQVENFPGPYSYLYLKTTYKVHPEGHTRTDLLDERFIAETIWQDTGTSTLLWYINQTGVWVKWKHADPNFPEISEIKLVTLRELRQRMNLE